MMGCMMRNETDNGQDGSRKVLWAVKKGQPKWKEEVIVETADPQRLMNAQTWAEDNGFDRFRVQTLDGKAPDFIGAVTGRPNRTGR